jgi:hypothetical protein
VGIATIPSIAAVHSQAGASNVNPSSRNNVNATGIRLRRRLSRFFHRDSADRGVARASEPGPGSREKSQRAICQPPRIQRGRRATSTL